VLSHPGSAEKEDAAGGRQGKTQQNANKTI
jgi:hypothetical protein